MTGKGVQGMKIRLESVDEDGRKWLVVPESKVAQGKVVLRGVGDNDMTL